MIRSVDMNSLEKVAGDVYQQGFLLTFAEIGFEHRARPASI